LNVAIKKVERIFENRTEAKRMLRELRILRKMKECREIVALYDILPPPNLNDFKSLMLVFEFVDTDLSRLFSSNQYFGAKHAPYILYQLLVSLKCLHTAKIIHRDLKPANVLINEDCSIRLCDFGLARSIEENLEQNPNPMSKKLVFGGQDNLAPEVPKERTVDRALTRHVVTRWYRPPEVILLDQKREFMDRIDMWSVGCIFGEMLMMDKTNVDHFRKRTPLFPGNSSFPLSPVSKERSKQVGVAVDDQLKIIFEVIGTPTEEEINSFSNEATRKYLRRFPKKKAINFRDKFPGASDEALDLLTKLLTFDKSKRLTVDQCLEHPYLKKNRKKKKEVTGKVEVFEFEDIKLTKDQIRELIVDEVLLFNPLLAAKFGLQRTPSAQNLQRMENEEKLDESPPDENPPPYTE